MGSVSILIPAYKPAFFRECLESAIAQTWEDKEIIVSDDCPSDAIKDICREFSRQVRYERNPAAGAGAYVNGLNLCRLSSGKYLKFLLDDDLLHPRCVESLVGALERTVAQDTVLAFSPRDLINEQNHVVDHVNLLGVEAEQVISGREILKYAAMKAQNPIGELTTVLFRREHIFEAGNTFNFQESHRKHWKGLIDVELFFDLLEKGNAVAYPATLSSFRVHQNSNSSANYNKDWEYVMTEWRLVVDRAIANGVLDKTEAGHAYLNLERHFKIWSDRYPAYSDALRDQINEIRKHRPDHAPRRNIVAKLLSWMNRAS